MIYGFRRMIYLLRKHDIISVPSYAAGIYHPPQVDIISKIYHPFRQERISLKNDKFLSKLVVFHGGAEGNLRSLSRLAAALRSALAFSLSTPWRQKRVPDTFLLALRFPSNQNKKAVLCTTFLFWWSRGESFSPAGSVRVGSDVPPARHSLPTRSIPLFVPRNKKKPNPFGLDFFLFWWSRRC